MRSSWISANRLLRVSLSASLDPMADSETTKRRTWVEASSSWRSSSELVGWWPKPKLEGLELLWLLLPFLEEENRLGYCWFCWLLI